MIFGSLASRARRIPIEPGMKFKKVGVGAFGQPISTLWTVDRLMEDLGGFPHVHLSLVADRTQKSVIAQDVILDPQYYIAHTP